MLQAWLNVAGLSLDFIGVILLANEWRIMFNAEQRETEIAAREQRLKRNPMMPPPNNPHQAVFDHMNEQLHFQQRHARADAVRSVRKSWFVTALVLIAFGFLLQLAGSWPH